MTDGRRVNFPDRRISRALVRALLQDADFTAIKKEVVNPTLIRPNIVPVVVRWFLDVAAAQLNCRAILYFRIRA